MPVPAIGACAPKTAAGTGALDSSDPQASCLAAGGPSLCPTSWATLAAWHRDADTERPHSRLGWQAPAEFAQTFTPQRGLTLRNPQSSAPAHVAQSAQMGKTQRPSLAHAE